MDRYTYRGKRIDDGEWVYGDFSRYNVFDEAIIYSDANNELRVDPETVGQCTEMMDKNEKMVFEGDMLWIDDEEGVLVVKWDDKTLSWALDDGFGNKDYLCDFVDSVEIVGNIHDEVSSDE